MVKASGRLKQSAPSWKRVMRIHPPEVIVDKGMAKLRARIDFDHDGHRFPDELWFSVPECFRRFFSCRVDPFVVTFSSLASSTNERIVADGQMSERLNVGLDEYWKVLSTWLPSKFKPIQVECEGLAADIQEADKAVAAAFSGGVDSFFTQFQNQCRPPGFRTRYAVFIHGFDIPLALPAVFERAAAAYEQALRGMGVTLIPVTTNARSFVPAINWGMGHGTLLCGTALALDSGISRFYVPSSKSYQTLEPWGSDPLTDPMLSTDRLQIIHDGALYTRFDKLNLMKDWEPLRQLLRTCYERLDANQNCGRCDNCRRTMMVLDSLGVLDEFTTFPRVRSSLHYVNVMWDTPHERLFGAQAIASALRRRNLALASVGRIAMLSSLVRRLLKKMQSGSRPFRRRMSAALKPGGGTDSASPTKSNP